MSVSLFRRTLFIALATIAGSLFAGVWTSQNSCGEGPRVDFGVHWSLELRSHGKEVCLDLEDSMESLVLLPSDENFDRSERSLSQEVCLLGRSARPGALRMSCGPAERSSIYSLT